jgi:hypothetical protein
VLFWIDKGRDAPPLKMGSSLHDLDRMSSVLEDKLPAELWLAVFSLLGADATPKDWISVELVCKTWRAAIAEWFGEWLKFQPQGPVAGRRAAALLQCAGSGVEIAFLMRHTEGE